MPSLETAPTLCKVLLDTNVLVAASLRFYVKALRLDVRHKFHDQSYRLFDLIKEHLGKRVGIITSTIEAESFGVLLQALTDTIEDGITDLEERRRTFEAIRSIADLCESRMRELSALLLREPTDESEVNKNLRLVEDMCAYLSKMAENFRDPLWVEKETGKKWFPTPFPTRWPAYLKKEGLDLRKEELRRDSIQYERYFEHPPSNIDKRILAEAIYLYGYYETMGKGSVSFFLASCDTRFFSPHRMSGGIESKPITEEIYRRFKIQCDWPYALLPLLKEMLSK